MPLAQGRVTYVNPPQGGSQFGSFKIDSFQERIGVHQDKLGQFQVGQMVSFEFSVKPGTKPGTQYLNFTRFAAINNASQFAGQQAPAQPPMHAPRGYEQQTAGARQQGGLYTPPASPRAPYAKTGQAQDHNYNTGKQICVTGVTQRMVQTGNFNVTDIPAIMRAVANAYDDIFGEEAGMKPVTTVGSHVPTYEGRGQTAGPREDVPFDDDHGLDDGGYRDDRAPPF